MRVLVSWAVPFAMVPLASALPPRPAPDKVLYHDGSDLSSSGGDVHRLVRIARPAGNVFSGLGTSDVRESLDAHAQFNRWAIGILNFIAINLGMPRVIAALNSGFFHPRGQGGYLAPATSSFPAPTPPVTAESLRLNPIGSLSRSLGRLNDCGEPLVLRASGF